MSRKKFPPNHLEYVRFPWVVKSESESESGFSWSYDDAPEAGVAELADAQDLGSCGETRGGSNPLARILFQAIPGFHIYLALPKD